MAKDPHDTPAMRQYRGFKEQYPDCLLLFRMGDFYECFYDDAKTISQQLGVTLTQRSNGIPMAGAPHHSIDGYIRRLVQAGFRVAICDQMETPAEAKGVIRREVTRLVTPGTLTDESMLDEGTVNHLAAVMLHPNEQATLSFAELSTGDFYLAQLPQSQLLDELARINPKELLYADDDSGQIPDAIQKLCDQLHCAPTARPAWAFRLREAFETLCKQFTVTTLAGFGLKDDDLVLGSAGAMVHYLLETQQSADGRIAHLLPPRRYQNSDHLMIDQTSLRSLEIERTLRSGETSGSLVDTLQQCQTPMGKRLFRQWLCYPLNERPAIEARQAIVQTFVEQTQLRQAIGQAIGQVQDVQRISSRIALGRPTPRDLVALGHSLDQLTQQQTLLGKDDALGPYQQRLDQIHPTLTTLGQQLRTACVDSPPAHMRDGGLIATGYDPELDEYRTLQTNSNQYLADYQAKLTEDSGINTLKIGYNRVFGYYIEVPHSQSDKVPVTFTRKQTLKNAERYITEELKVYEDRVLGAAQQAVAREQYLFNALCQQCADQLDALHQYAQLIAELDVLISFAERAVRYQYVRPTLVDTPTLDITEGRHPVLDQYLADQFVPNDIDLHPETSLGLITGPNMAGKSTYIRQAALLTLLAHTGSFLPAQSATIGMTDRIFTRIGASDEIHLGQSTFMVEMTETANICHHATERSLVILDEIGRGTSTLDGLSLAWAITEHLAKRGCRTLFATHYHELTQLTEQWPQITNLNVTVREWQDQILFLHRIEPGATDKSYGVHVAQIAGLPQSILTRAKAVMNRLELNTPGTGTPAPGNETPSTEISPASEEASNQSANQNNTDHHTNDHAQTASDAEAFPLFAAAQEHPAIDILRQIDLNSLSPLQAFDQLRQLKSHLDSPQ